LDAVRAALVVARVGIDFKKPSLPVDLLSLPSHRVFAGVTCVLDSALRRFDHTAGDDYYGLG